MVKIKIDREKCTGCGICAETCSLARYRIGKGKKKAYVVSARAAHAECVVCGACEVSCPKHAIAIIEED